ncbi:MAG: RICIN domain-containing protein [Clostridiales bacterium]|jgi:hypothetical protein|nr:RICIN domain-containing protein [Clostridiales bacterium]
MSAVKKSFFVFVMIALLLAIIPQRSYGAESWAVVDDGWYAIKYLNTNMAVNIQYRPKAYNGALTVLDSFNSEDNEIFYFSRQSDNSYRISPKYAPSASLEISNSGTENGSRTQIWEHSSQANCMYWYLVKRGNYYCLINKNSYQKSGSLSQSLFLNVDNGETGSGTLVHSWKTDGDYSRFTLSKLGDSAPAGAVTNLNGQTFAINYRDSSLGLKVKSGNYDNGQSTIVLSNPSDSWRFELSSDGYSYYIVPLSRTDGVLDLDAGGINNNATRLQIWGRTSGDQAHNQRWYVIQDGKYYRILNKSSWLKSGSNISDSLFIDNDNGQAQSDNPVHTWKNYSQGNTTGTFKLAAPSNAGNESAVLSRLSSISSQNGKQYQGDNQCKGFASYVFNKVFGSPLPATGNTNSSSGLAYAYVSSSVVSQIGQLKDIFTSSQLKDLVSKAKAGDVLQVSKATTSGAHTYIIMSKDSSGFSVIDANSDNNNTIRYNKHVTYADVASIRKGGATLYRATNYDSVKP